LILSSPTRASELFHLAGTKVTYTKEQVIAMRSSPLSQSPLVLPQIPGVTSPMLAPVANKATPSGSVCHKYSGQNLRLVDEIIEIEYCAFNLLRLCGIVT
jgi:hypothetical protein